MKYLKLNYFLYCILLANLIPLSYSQDQNCELIKDLFKGENKFSFKLKKVNYENQQNIEIIKTNREQYFIDKKYVEIKHSIGNVKSRNSYRVMRLEKCKIRILFPFSYAKQTNPCIENINFDVITEITNKGITYRLIKDCGKYKFQWKTYNINWVTSKEAYQTSFYSDETAKILLDDLSGKNCKKPEKTIVKALSLDNTQTKLTRQCKVYKVQLNKNNSWSNIYIGFDARMAIIKFYEITGPKSKTKSTTFSSFN